MPSGASRANKLDPSAIILLTEDLYRKGALKEEVHIRRFLSMLYFALFNYWCAKKYDAGLRRGGILGDQWPYKDFHNELLRKRLGRYVVFLAKCRVAADHYTLNPTYVELRLGKRILNVELTLRTLNTAISYAKEVYRNLALSS